MADLLTLENLGDLIMLILLQAVLGFDNLLYISLESKKAPLDEQSKVRKIGIGVAIFLRIALLFGLMNLIGYVKIDLLTFNVPDVVEGHFNLHSVIVLVGGIFILYTAMKEIWHMMSNETEDRDENAKPKSSTSVIIWIVLINLVFSFDSILSAMALSKVFAIMAIAIVIGGILMIWLADKVSAFLQKNRMYEVLGLFVLFVVGIMLITEGGELADLHIFNNAITHMNKTTFYFVITILVLTDIVQSKYQKKLSKKLSK
ncbi:MAG: putative tellurium resistance membrane protein TerC [Bacteroidia bacterium]|jgi:predicted tellurium resistance membrane protein TerC